jgi:hypothetical protein
MSFPHRPETSVVAGLAAVAYASSMAIAVLLTLDELPKRRDAVPL